MLEGEYVSNIQSIDHVAIVVRDLKASEDTYASLFGAVEVGREELPEQGVVAAMIEVGDGLMELISPTRDDSGVARFLDKRGEGVHHVAYRVNDIGAELEKLRQVGARLVDEAPRRGFANRLVAFVHPESAHGVLVELVQILPSEGSHGE